MLLTQPLWWKKGHTSGYLCWTLEWVSVLLFLEFCEGGEVFCSLEWFFFSGIPSEWNSSLGSWKSPSTAEFSASCNGMVWPLCIHCWYSYLKGANWDLIFDIAAYSQLHAPINLDVSRAEARVYLWNYLYGPQYSLKPLHGWTMAD